MFANSADGVPVRYETNGFGKPALVFVHGWSCHRTYWQRQMKAFSARHLVVSLDLAGHGDSGDERRQWGMEAFGQDVAAVVRHLDLDEIVLVGHSMGGSVILEAAELLGERVIGLVPVDTFFDVESRLSKEQAEQFLQPFRADFRAATRRYLSEHMFVEETDPALKETIVSELSMAEPSVAIESLGELLTYDTPAALTQIKAPIHCINSDRYVTRVDVAQRHTRSFNAERIPSVGHFPMIEKPEEFNRLLADVIRRFAANKSTDKN
jgi:pimeloyl-ACP methyl ester carboxylesterase